MTKLALTIVMAIVVITKIMMTAVFDNDPWRLRRRLLLLLLGRAPVGGLLFS